VSTQVTSAGEGVRYRSLSRAATSNFAFVVAAAFFNASDILDVRIR
jgi:hypothetical protein